MIDLSQLNNSPKKFRSQFLNLFTVLLILVLVLGVFDVHASDNVPDIDKGNPRTSNGTRTRALYNFTIECEDTTHLTNGGEPTDYTIIIQNTGTQQDTYLISFEIIEITGGDEPDEEDWEGYLDKDSISLAPNDSGEVVLNVYSSCTCQEGYTTTIRITVESVNAPTLSKFIDTFTEYGPEENSVDLENDDLSIFSTASAGQTVPITIKIYNLQNVAQSYKMNNTGNPKQLAIDFQKADIEVGPNSVVNFQVQITIPEKNEPGYYNLTFHVQSENDPFIEDTILIPLTFYPELAVTNITPSAIVTERDSEVSFKVTVKNLGQAACRNFPVALYDSAEYNDEDIIETQFVPELFGNEEFTLTFKWSPSQEGSYNVTAFVNPDLKIKEVSNRFGNNYETVEITIKDKIKPSDGGDGKNTSQNGDDKDDGSIMSSPVFWAGLGAVACMIVVLIVLFFIRQEKSETMDDDEKADKNLRGRQEKLTGKGRNHARPAYAQTKGQRNGRQNNGRRRSGRKRE